MPHSFSPRECTVSFETTLKTLMKSLAVNVSRPLLYQEKNWSSLMIVASKGGAPAHPAWYLNLQANPDVQVQVKADKFAARARTAEAGERASLWRLMVDIYAPYEAYQKKTDRQIPVVVLERQLR